MQIAVIIVASLLCVSAVPGADPSEKGISTSPLKIYSGGFGSGAVQPLGVETKDVSGRFLKLSIVNSFTITRNVELFLDADWLLPGKNGGGTSGLDWISSSSRIRPFAGLGAGAYHIDHDGAFGDNFGISLTAHAGALIEVTESMALRLRIPYYAILNDYHDDYVGLECGMLFSSRFKSVRKLNYR